MSRFRPSILILAITFTTMWGCEKMSLVSPTGSTITLTVNKTSVPINGTAEVTAAVIESAGTPVQNGTVVTFTSSFGTIDPREARTNGGTARVTFTGTESGTAKIGAFSGGAKTAADLEVKVGAAGASAVVVRAEPSSLPQGGGTVQVFALIRDAGGTPLAGVSVSFTSDQGTLSASSAVTNADGQALVTLTTSRETIVTAEVTGAATAVKGTTTVRIISAPAVTVGGPASATVGLPANFTITPTAPGATGAPLRDVVVNWGDGSAPRNLGPITSATTVSHTFDRADSYTVTATATDQTGQQGTGSFSVNVSRVLPTIGITCPANAFTGTPAAYTVTPPATSAFPIQNVTVDFGDGTSRNLGQITGPTSFTKTYTAAGGYTVTATVTDTNGQRGSSSCAVIVTTRQPTITISHTSPPVNPNTSESFSVTATPAPGGGSAVTNIRVVRSDTGEVFNFAGSSGTFSTTTFGSGTSFTLEATATDATGNTGTTSFFVTVP